MNYLEWTYRYPELCPTHIVDDITRSDEERNEARRAVYRFYENRHLSRILSQLHDAACERRLASLRKH